MERTYETAVSSLNTLQSNFSIVDAIRKSGGKLNENAISEMQEWCRKIGYEPSAFNALNVIHIAGTKGKGSTAAFCSSILNQFVGITPRSSPDGKPLSKVGLYTSPHLRYVRERIQINGEPLSKGLFTKYFFEVWDRLESSATAAGQDPSGKDAKPLYFRFLTLMAFHAYMREKVDVAIIECGVGGAYDSTNIIEKPIVTGITNLGIDHVAMLGSTIQEIAWHKSGIMKNGVWCWTTDTQPEEAAAVMKQQAKAKGARLHACHIAPQLTTGDWQLGLEGDFQKVNATIAHHLALDWLRERGYKYEAFQQGVDQNALRYKQGMLAVRWPGRCDIRQEKNIKWLLDGGHTAESLRLAGTWFTSRLSSSTGNVLHEARVLIFNQQQRDAVKLVTELRDTVSKALHDHKPFTNVIFCTNTTRAGTGYAPDLVSLNVSSADVGDLKVQRELQAAYLEMDPDTSVEVVATIEEAVSLVRKLAQDAAVRDANVEVPVLVTGSLHLVGGFLEVFEGDAQP